ncbi:MAG: hypothetical protein GC191_12565 [Azospirillum sp.]|nr:hypothetical protein [Azospirillum sp.]
MTTKPYFMGAGGSGAKTLEALVHTAASGLAGFTPEIEASLVDQDINNGNLVYATALVKLYQELYLYFSQPLREAGNDELFATRLVMPNDSQAWLPIESGSLSLGAFFQRQLLRDDVNLLFRCLFDQRQEIDQDLAKGFRGRPVIGSAILGAIADIDHRLGQYLQSIADSEQGDSRLFLVGSVFGGTGAAGLPTIASLMRPGLGSEEPAIPHGDRVRIGAAPLLPYFLYKVVEGGGEDADAADGTLAKTADQLTRSRIGVEYYHYRGNGGANGNGSLFDVTYLLGQDPRVELGYQQIGGELQRNPAMVVELLAALASLHFFRSKRNGSGTVMRLKTESDERLDWEDFPAISDDGDNSGIYYQLGQLLRFAYAYRYCYCWCLIGDESRRFAGQPWFRRLLGPEMRDGLTGEDAKIAEKLNVYCGEILRWAASLKLLAPGAFVAFVSARDFAEAHVASEHRPARVQLASEPDHYDPILPTTGGGLGKAVKLPPFNAAIAEGFERLLGDDERRPVPDLSAVFEFMNRQRPPRAIRPGLVAFVNALWRATAVVPERTRRKLRQTPR